MALPVGAAGARRGGRHRLGRGVGGVRHQGPRKAGQAVGGEEGQTSHELRQAESGAQVKFLRINYLSDFEDAQFSSELILPQAAAFN